MGSRLGFGVLLLGVVVSCEERNKPVPAPPPAAAAGPEAPRPPAPSAPASPEQFLGALERGDVAGAAALVAEKHRARLMGERRSIVGRKAALDRLAALRGKELAIRRATLAGDRWAIEAVLRVLTRTETKGDEILHATPTVTTPAGKRALPSEEFSVGLNGEGPADLQHSFSPDGRSLAWLMIWEYRVGGENKTGWLLVQDVAP